MPKSVLTEGINFTEGCANCPFWSDGSIGGFGCTIPAPIMDCPYFRKMYEEEQKEGKQIGKTDS